MRAVAIDRPTRTEARTAAGSGSTAGNHNDQGRTNVKVVRMVIASALLAAGFGVSAGAVSHAADAPTTAKAAKAGFAADGLYGFRRTPRGW